MSSLPPPPPPTWPPPPPPPPPGWAPPGPDDGWLRLDPRMLLVHPIREVVRFLPVLLGLLLAGGAAGGAAWAVLGVGVPVALGVVRYLTTTFRIGQDRVELRRGLLQRHTLSTPVDRVRTVDLTASPIHRLLGLATVVVGTGSVVTDADERLELDALPREQADALRTDLLRRVGAAPAAAAASEDPADVVARFRPAWLWYAPFSGTVLVAAGAVVGAAAQVLEIVDLRIDGDDLAVPAASQLLVIAVGALLVAAALAVGGYLVTNGGFELSRQHGTWHIRRGLLTRRETSIDVARLAGASVAEPAALRLARGRRVRAIVTGLSGDQSASSLLLPPAPADLAAATATAVLGNPAPVVTPLLTHGRAARTRRFTRALLGVTPVAVVLVALAAADVPTGGAPWLLALAGLTVVAAVALAVDRSRALGHAHAAGHVVVRSGSLARSRDMLADAHVIGWNLRATWFQRRAGLVSLAATTAGGGGAVTVPDVPNGAVLELAAAATPGLLEQFTAAG